MTINKINFPIYGIIILISIIIGMIYIYIKMKKENFKNKNILLYFILYLTFSITFGKIFNLLVNDENINIINTGLSSYGGVIGIILASFIFEKILPTNKKIIKYSIISLTIVYSISKIACFVSGCCYGIPYNGIFSVKYPNVLNISLFPVQLLETIIFFIIFLVCNKIRNNRNIIYLTIILSSFAKFSLDFLRYDHVTKNITVNQIFSILLIIITLIIYIINRNRKEE